MTSAIPKVVKPRRLKPGDTIGIVAPASPFPRDELAQGLSVLHAQGFATRLAEGLFARTGFLAGDDMHRAAQLHAMFADETVHAIMCARGGYGTLRLLPQLDYRLIRSHPKPLIGFSDISALHQAILLKSGLVTFHGPMVCTLAHGDAVTRASLQKVLSTDFSYILRSSSHRSVKPGQARGTFVGGNLATVCHLIGTPFARNYSGCILFLEEVGEPPYRIDRMLVHMILSGCLDGLCGLVLGAFKECGPLEEIYGIVRQLFDAWDIPILAGITAGHDSPNVTLPFGIESELDAVNGTLRFLESAVHE